jgi:HEAT repeat protein
MFRNRTTVVLGLLAVMLNVAPGRAWSQDEPRTLNGKQETVSVSQNLDKTIAGLVAQGKDPAWIGYSVEEVGGQGRVCCENYYSRDDNGCGMCRLENGHDGFNTRKSDGTVGLEGAEKLVVMLRVAENHVMRIRIASSNCTLDAGGLRLTWLKDVKAAESVALLKEYVRTADFEGEGDHRISEQALGAIALHRDASADRVLASLAAKDQPAELRKRTSFWLGEARGGAGLEVLKQMAKSDPDPEIRAQVTFALSVSKQPGALDEMIRMAHEDESSHVRGQALFWLAQKAGKKAASTITGAIDNDPDTEVKKKAVFALSQMPKDEGVPKLIQVAQTNRNPEVRKQAMFWLGESHDPRALAFFEKVLSQ